MPAIDTPFDTVAIDMVGPLVKSALKHCWVLTMVDYATRYPEAVPCRGGSIFSRVGIPRQILSDRGSQFTSDLMKEVARLLSIKQLAATPYHAMCGTA